MTDPIARLRGLCDHKQSCSNVGGLFIFSRCGALVTPSGNYVPEARLAEALEALPALLDVAEALKEIASYPCAGPSDLESFREDVYNIANDALKRLAERGET